jgi:hypothetical protein
LCRPSDCTRLMTRVVLCGAPQHPVHSRIPVLLKFSISAFGGGQGALEGTGEDGPQTNPSLIATLVSYARPPVRANG